MNRVRSFNEIAMDEEGRADRRPFSTFILGITAPFRWCAKNLFPLKTKPAPLVMFVFSFVLYMLSVLPVLIMHRGLFFYYGDYNVQQVPFYILAHRAFRSGHIFWNFGLDLGGSVAGDLSFYLTGSPFFWLTLFFPERIVPYLMPYLMALKYATGATFAYLYLKKHLRTEEAARTGALLYAFSGFHAVNIVFNHFTDAACFFPALMYAFDALMDASRTGRKEDYFKEAYLPWLKMTLMVALLAVINYYFFFGMVVFLVLYALIRYVNKEELFCLPKRLLSALSTGITGVLMAALVLTFAFASLAGNQRLDRVLSGYELLTYPDAKMYFDILKNMVMTPDIIGRGTVFYTTTVKNASLAAYLPMFGIAGVAAFLHMRRKQVKWLKRLLLVSLFFAMIPGLNALFSMLNTQYYARWYYCPVLYMALATAKAAEDGRERDLKAGAAWEIACFLFMVLVFFLPSKDADGNWEWLNMSENPEYFILDAIVTSVMCILLLLTVFFVKRKRTRLRLTYVLTSVCALALTMNVVAKGKTLISMYGMEMWKEQMLDTRPVLPEEEGVFYRVDTDDTATNYEMVWGYPTIHCFLSTVPAEIFTFYDGTAGITRWVESELPVNRCGIRALLSTRYYIWNSAIYEEGEFGKGEGVYGFDEIVFEGNGLTVYENKNYIPPGFTFGYYIRESVFDECNKPNMDKFLVKALILPDETADAYGALMTELSREEAVSYISEDTFDALCDERRKSACTYFTPTDSGFRAVTADLEKENLVFFSVPASKGFTVYLDGAETDYLTADYGLMALDVPAGVHEIEARYVPDGIERGAMLTFTGMTVVVMYGLLSMVIANKKEKRDMI